MYKSMESVFLLEGFSLTALALGFHMDKKTRDQKASNIPSLGQGTRAGPRPRGARWPFGSLWFPHWKMGMYQRFRWFPREKCERISGFAGSLAKSVNVLPFSLVPLRKVWMYKRFRWFPCVKCERTSISVCPGSLAWSANAFAFSLVLLRKVRV